MGCNCGKKKAAVASAAAQTAKPPPQPSSGTPTVWNGDPPSASDG